jgi:hypothetical protein
VPAKVKNLRLETSIVLLPSLYVNMRSHPPIITAL